MNLRLQERPLRSLLFVPGSRRERFDKALDSGADLVCIDLEDAVPPAEKENARAAVLDYLAETDQTSRPANRSPLLGVRVNGLGTTAGEQDALAVAKLRPGPDFVMLPKVEYPQTLLEAAERLPGIRLMPIVETPLGMHQAVDIFTLEEVEWGLFGGGDYSAETGVQMNWEGLRWARGALVNAAAAGGALLFDVPYVNVADRAGLLDETRRGRTIGLQARAAIHPAQIPVIHQALAPDEQEIAHARRIVAAFEASSGAATLLDGRLIELPLIRAAQRTLALAGDDMSGESRAMESPATDS